MLLLTLTGWASLTALSSTINHNETQVNEAPEVFFGLHTYPPTMYDGMERYGCEDSHCREIVEVNTDFGVGKLSDGRFIALHRPGRSRHQSIIGSLTEASQGRMTQWQTTGTPAHAPDIANYRLSVAQRISQRGTYLGLWQNLGAGRFGQTLVILFNDIQGEDSSQGCGPYHVLAAVDHRVTILETRPVYHIGEAVNLASYDDSAKTVWVARLILSEHEPVCR